MLKIKRLELAGFKSFCDRQELRFTGDGIAAVVGPNGCGKSNIGDGISWVLGQQSAKSLRGTRMRDLIFNGSRDRKPSGMATVSLTLLDPEVYLRETRDPAGNGKAHKGAKRPGEITVTRKLYRSGESHYLLNGKICRLRDIQDLFMGTGLGGNHYALIEQGRIEQILSSRPLDRRAYVEEAAGVTRFKNRKRLAELKLESARQNLNRVNDILQEVTRQANSLKRQASKARRYEELRGQLKERLGSLLASQSRSLQRVLDETGRQVEAVQADHAQLSGQVNEVEKGRQNGLAEQHEREQDLARDREQLSQSRVEIERLNSRVEQQTRMAAENAHRVEQGKADIESLDCRIQEMGEELRREQAVAEDLALQSSDVKAQVQLKTADLGKHQERFAQAQQSQESLRQEVLRLLGELSTLRNHLTKIDEFHSAHRREMDRCSRECSSAEHELSQLEKSRNTLEGTSGQERAALRTVAERRQAIEEELSERKRRLIDERAAAAAAQEELSKLKARGDSLEQILSHHAYTTETVKNLFAAIEKTPGRQFQPVGILADYVEVDPQYEKQVEDFLQDELEYVVVRSWEDAREGIAILRREVQGFTTFLVYPEKQVVEETPVIGPEPGLVGRLSDYVRLANGLSESASALLPRLRRCYLVTDEQVARRLAVQYPDLYFLLPDGVCYRGHTVSGGSKKASGPLALKRELRELRPAIAKQTEELATAREKSERTDQEISENETELSRVQNDLQNREKAVLATEHERRQLNDHVDRASRRLAISRGDLERLEREAEGAEQKRRQMAEELERLGGQRQQAEERLAALQAEIQEGQEVLTRLREEQTELRTCLATFEERWKAAVASLDKARHQLSEQRSRREGAVRHVDQWSTERTNLLEDNVRLTALIQQSRVLEREVEERIDAHLSALGRIREAVSLAEQVLTEKRAALEETRERRSALEVRLAELRGNRQRLEEAAQRDVEKTLEELAAEHQQEQTDEELREAEQAAENLRAKLAGIGPVNVLALEEYEESQQRQEFLETQRQDLLDSIRNTQKAISEIDVESRRRFKDAFDAINANFREVFQTLFDGGVAEMRITDPDNEAESGVDIIAQPPGKRLQNVGLLSGGEKSLTAIALLMATFRYKPSPFCLLDEVDAALDEPNLHRLRRLVREMSDQVQFVIVTHSKTTMEAAQALYGVTMEEPGVSRLVSVRLPDAEPDTDQTSRIGAGPTLAMRN